MAYFKTILRLLKGQLSRLITLTLIIMVSIGFVSGIGEVKTKINESTNKFYLQKNLMDLNVKKASGFSTEEINFLINTYGQENVNFGFFNFDALNINGQIYRVYNNFGKGINNLKLIDGRLPQNNLEVLQERKTDGISCGKLGDQIEIFGKNYTIVGTVISPLLIHTIKENSFIETSEKSGNYKPIDRVIYLYEENFAINEVYISFKDKSIFNDFSKDYQTLLEQEKLKVQSSITGSIVLTLNENYGIKSLSEYANKVAKIGVVFIAFFMLITCLVVFSTMTRLLEEERGQIATFKTLGYGNFKIVLRYLIFILIACIVGGALAFGVGQILTLMIYKSFEIQYVMPPMLKSVKVFYYLIALACIVISALLVTLITGLSTLKEQPAKLLVPKAPKEGKKVFLENIKFIWEKLSFKYKSTIRNILLFKSRFFMTVISIMGSSVLVLAGLSLLDNTFVVDSVDSVRVLAGVVIAFAGALGALVIYNLTNINVSERKREIATLMVLGYTDKEVKGYIYREVYILSIIGAIIGLPVGYWFLDVVFNFINFGSVANTNWYSWILAPIIIMFFVFISTQLLKSKILKTDMNASLKSVE